VWSLKRLCLINLCQQFPFLQVSFGVSPRVSLSPLSPFMCRYRPCFAAPATACPLQCHWSWQCPSAFARAHHAAVEGRRGGAVELQKVRAHGGGGF